MAKKEFKLEHPEWEKQKGETQLAYSRFRVFRNLGPTRSLRKTAIALNIPDDKVKVMTNSLANHSWKYKWFERIAKYEQHLDEIEQKENTAAIKEMARRHADHSKAFEHAIMLPVKTFMNKLKENQDNDLKDKTLSELLKMITGSADAFHKVTNIERKSRGEPNEINELQTDENGFKIILPSVNKEEDE